jgi:streptomycin 6-kinase
VTLRRWFKALFDQAEADRGRGVDSIFVRAASRADSALANPRDQRVLHGDNHHENIRRSARGWLAFDPKGIYGERAYDLANTMCNPEPHYGVAAADEDRILRNADILARTCGIEQRRVLLFLYLYACLSASWVMQEATTGDLGDTLEIAAIAERHL